MWGFKNTPIRIFDSLNVKPLRISVHIPAVRKPPPFICMYYAVNVIAAYSYFDSNPKYTLYQIRLSTKQNCMGLKKYGPLIY
jgi:hypothetical protein